MMNIVWKIGVKAHASRLSGSLPGWAGASGGWGVADGATAPDAPSAAPPGTHAAATSATRTTNRIGARRRQAGGRVTERRASSTDRVIPTRVPWVAAGDALGTHPAPFEQPVLVDRLLRVVRTGGLVPARGGQPDEHDAVEPDEPDPDPLHRLGPPIAPPRTSVRCNAPTSVSWSASTIAGRAMMRTSQPGWNEGAITRSASRSRRRARFLMTAPPRRRPVDRPNRVVSRSVRRNRTEKRGWDRVVPAPWIAAKSCGRESITSRGGFGPRPLVRASAASDHEPVVRQGRGGHRSSSSGRGSRVPWRDDASLAGRSASSGLSGILSIRPRGRSHPSSPKGTQTRPAPTGAWRVLVRRMIGPAGNGCQTSWRSTGSREAVAGRSSAGAVGPSVHAGVWWRANAPPRWVEAVGRSSPETGGRNGWRVTLQRYPWGVCANRLATPSAPVLSSP